MRASKRSVFAFASVIDFSLRVLATSTQTPWLSNTETILSEPAVASNATTSLASKLCANSFNDATRVATRPTLRTPSPSATATSQKSRWTSNPNARTPSPFPRQLTGSAAGHTTTTDSCSQHTREGRRGGHEQLRAHSSSLQHGLPIRVSQQSPISREHHAHGEAGHSLIPRQLSTV